VAVEARLGDHDPDLAPRGVGHGRIIAQALGLWAE